MDTKQLLDKFKQTIKECIYELFEFFPNHKNELRNFLKYCKHKKTKEIVELYHNDTSFLEEELNENNKFDYFYIKENSCWIFNIDFIEMMTSYDKLTNEQIDTIYHHLFNLRTLSTLLMNEQVINTTIQLKEEDLEQTNQKFTELIGEADPTIQNLIGEITNGIRSNNGQFDFAKLLEQTTKSIEDKVNNGEITEEQLRLSAESMLSKMPMSNMLKNMFL
jgi:hypothetical protein